MVKHLSTCRLGMLAIFKRALDIALRNRKADFIKMDIEGAETNALVGAYQVVSGIPSKSFVFFPGRRSLFNLIGMIDTIFILSSLF